MSIPMLHDSLLVVRLSLASIFLFIDRAVFVSQTSRFTHAVKMRFDIRLDLSYIDYENEIEFHFHN
jgi:hypothetical protein